MISSQTKNASLPLEAREIKEGVKIDYKILSLKVKLSHILKPEENKNLTGWKISQIVSDCDNAEDNHIIDLHLHFEPK